MPWRWPYTRDVTETVDPSLHAAKLAELHRAPQALPPIGGERLMQTSADFAEIVLLYAMSRPFSLATPAEIREVAQKAVLWYYGLEER